MTLTSLKSLELRSLGLAREREAELPSRLPDNPVVLSLFRSGTIGAVALGSSAFLGELYDGEEEDPVQSAGGLVDCCASRGLRTSTDSDLGSLPYADDQNMACLLWFGPVTHVHELDVTGAPFCVLPLPTRTSNILSPRRRGSIVVPEQSSSRCQPTDGRSPLSWCFPCLAESSNVLGVDCTLCLAFGACLGSATTVLARTSSGIPTASDVMGVVKLLLSWGCDFYHGRWR